MGEGLRGRRMWYSLKCNRFELLPLRRDGDFKKLMKGNDEYAYLYVAGSEAPQGGGCSDRGRGGATVSAGDVAHGVDGGVVTSHVVRDATKGNTGEGGEADEAVVVEECMKLGLKFDKQKTELEKWKNSVGDRIEKKLRKTLANIGSVADVKLFNTVLREYGVLLTNNRSLVKLWVYDYVSDCYKAGSQGTIYMNIIHSMETHDSATVDNATGLVIGGEALHDGYNRRILPPLNPRPQGRPRKRRIESQRQGVQVRKCSKCGEVGHYTHAGIRALISMQIRQLLLYPWRIYLKTTMYRRHNMKVTCRFLTHIPG
ncbi:hypothetical protein Cgig2_002992 [Carnegiea gigantea]|uniref:Uncharacterized protein n=1 Tax=Carnegiea gigantea TaxID=171969 RepID=A0A9Q1K6U2_9CARY|nr:hypothetical protein Cgig2_002992 [Carnegiea gigantea]